MNAIDTLSLEGKIQPDQTKTYLMLPFDLPPDVVRLDVSYDYSAAIGSDPQLVGGNTIDIGLFDPRGVHFMSEGCRGWSGSARSEFYLTALEATPGYMPGPLQAGTWHICLGAYKVADNGCDYRVDITLTRGVQPAQSTFPKRLELSTMPHLGNKHENGWYKGELHCHTYNSDGDSDPLDVVRQAEALGLDFLAITDHNALSHQIRLRDIETTLMLMPGMEVTTYAGHWNIWGAGGWIDFRVTSERDMQQAVNAALEQGYLISCNHPRPFGPEWVYTAIAGFNCIEVWNGPWELLNDQCLAYWESKLRAGEHYAAVGGSDCHFLKRDHHARLGHPTTVVYIEGDPSPQVVLNAIKAGHAYVTESPTGPHIVLQVGDALMGDTISPRTDRLPVSVCVLDAADMQLEVCGANGILQQLLIPEAEWETVLDVDISQATYIRAQLVSDSNHNRRIHALSNPIYLVPNS